MEKSNHSIVIVHNIIAPYKVALFNELYKLIPSLKVIFIAEKESRRDWIIDYTKIEFPYELLFKGPIDNLNKISIARQTWNSLNNVNPSSLVVCDYSNIFGWAALFWGKKNNSKMVFWLDSTKEDKKHYFPKEQIKHFFLKHFDLYLAPGEKTKEYLTFMHVENEKIIKTGYAVDSDYYSNEYNALRSSNLRQQFEAIKTPKNFLFAGRLSKEKNIFTLLKAFNNLKDLNKEWGLIILGDGPQKMEITNFIADNNLSNRIHLAGFIQQSEIVKYYAFSNVFILPSKSEPWGLVVNEAMLCELPVIVSSKCGSVSELVMEGINGFTFDPANQKNLEEIMIRFFSGEINIKKFGAKSLEIIANHSPQNVALKIYNNFQEQQIL